MPMRRVELPGEPSGTGGRRHGASRIAERATARSGTQPFCPPRGLRNGHLQSILGVSRLRQRALRAAGEQLLAGSEEVLLDCGEGVRLQGFFASPPTGTPARGLVVCLHGWEGAVTSSYLVATATHLLGQGYAIFRLHYRDHGDTHHLNEGIFHSCRIREVVAAVADVARRYLVRPLSLVGFSLGGNFALRVALRAPAAAIPLDRVIAVAPVIEPLHTVAALERSWGVYQRHFLGRWRQSLLLKQRAFPDLYDMERCQAMTTIREITHYVITRYTDFDRVDDYFNGYALGGGKLKGLAVPTTIIAAQDDPIIPVADIECIDPVDGLDVEITRYGGHCGYLCDFRMQSWVERRIAELLAS